MATYFWHLKTEPKNIGTSDADVIAYISKTKLEIQRKGANNTLWEPAENLDRLRAGDSVRTSSQSEARIQFYQSNRYIDLEPESMIVIQKSKTEISLELLEGSLFVNGVDKNASNALTMKSQSGKVDLSKSAAQLSGSSNSKMELKVLKGSAQVVKKGGKVVAIEEGKGSGLEAAGLKVDAEPIKILSPDTAKSLFVNAINPEPILIQWSGFAPNAKVNLFSGSSRKNLKPINTELISPTQLQVPWKTGTYYWQLRGSDPQNPRNSQQSSIYKTEVIGRFPPTPISPEANFVLQTRRALESVTLRWNAGAEFKDVFLELKNNSTNQMIVRERFSNMQDSLDVPNLPLANYSWRLTGYPVDGSKPITGPFIPFSIDKKRIIKLPMVWNTNLKPLQFYVNSDPKLTLMWDPGEADRVKKYTVHIAPEGTDISKGEITEAKQIKFEKAVPKDGRYLAYVEAFDEEGDRIGATEVRTFGVELLPLLPPPTLLPANQKDFMAQPDGTLAIQWNNIEGAKEYQILLEDSEGKPAGEFTSIEKAFNLSNLMPGSYSMQIATVDPHGRRGPLAAKRFLVVPDKSAVQAPKLRKIRVN
jgi:hypothetical protein